MLKAIIEIKATVSQIIGGAVHVKDNGKYFTVSRKDSTTDNGFGHYIPELKAVYSITRLDGCSFDIPKAGV